MKLKDADDRKSILNDLELEDNTGYSFVLAGLAFRMLDGLAMKDYPVSFRTK
ncbi:hypothetical protein [Sphingobacterium sp. MYb382]|uniref:hypothetical protein n=1 Tax=Sphingobacterium sp. MYb382 TaxID=2745278 RepID=UPI0030AA0057